MNKTPKKTDRYTILAFGILIALALGYILYLNTPTYIRTEISPDGKYKLEIYAEPMLFAMPGGGGDNYAQLILRHSNGEFIGKVNSDSGHCAVMLRDVEVFWLDELAYYARSAAINVNSGECG